MDVERRAFLNQTRGLLDVNYRSRGELHRDDGGPARMMIMFHDNEMIAVMASWVRDGEWCSQRLAKGLPNGFHNQVFFWRIAFQNKLHNLSGPAWLKLDTPQTLQVGYFLQPDVEVSFEDFQCNYLITHLKEYPRPTQKELRQYYNKLYAEAKMWAEKEISLGFVLT